MIKNKETSTSFTKYERPPPDQALDTNYEIKRHSIIRRPDSNVTRYTHTYAFSIRAFDDINKVYVEIENVGYFDIDKTVQELIERDLFECIQFANQEIEELAKKKGFFKSAILIHPNFEVIKPVLTELLNKRPH
jgi:hypothetical protein